MLNLLKRFWLIAICAPVLLFGAFYYTNTVGVRVGPGNGLPAVWNDQGAFFLWNAQASTGATYFINQHGAGSGGWYGYDLSPGASSLGTAAWSITPSGFETLNSGLSTNNGAIQTGYLFENGQNFPASGLIQGGYLAWNKSGGSGEMDLITQYGGGAGGFNFYNSGGTVPGTLLGRLDNTGTLSLNGVGAGSASIGSLTTGTSSEGTVTVTGTTNLVGALNGRTQAVETGQTCTTGTTQNAVCTSTVTWPTSFANTSYKAFCTGVSPNTSVGVPYIVGITAKTTSNMTVQISNGAASSAQAAYFGALDCFGTP